MNRVTATHAAWSRMVRRRAERRCGVPGRAPGARVAQHPKVDDGGADRYQQDDQRDRRRDPLVLQRHVPVVGLADQQREASAGEGLGDGEGLQPEDGPQDQRDLEARPQLGQDDVAEPLPVGRAEDRRRLVVVAGNVL